MAVSLLNSFQLTIISSSDTVLQVQESCAHTLMGATSHMSILYKATFLCFPGKQSFLYIIGNKNGNFVLKLLGRFFLMREKNKENQTVKALSFLYVFIYPELPGLLTSWCQLDTVTVV